LGRTTVNLKIGKIQDRSGLDKQTAVILPVNTSFIDDCIRDENSTTGAYILEFYSDKVSELPQIMIEQLKKYGYKQKENGTYEPGTTILLPSPYDIPAKVLMTASTLRKEKVGIKAEPSTICECIRKIFEFTSDKKISKFRMPVLGSGHGGLDINEALLFLVHAVKYYSERVYHHVKQIDIVIRDEDTTRLKDVYMQHLMLLGEESK
jgi:O-acetyl-ADP-ribose deacetylase (regulator of RNase III)